MGFNFKTVWPGDYIESAVAVPRRDDPEGNPAKYYRVRLQVRDVSANIGTHPDSVPWGLCRAETPVPALPLPFIIIGATVLFLLRYRACRYLSPAMRAPGAGGGHASYPLPPA